MPLSGPAFSGPVGRVRFAEHARRDRERGVHQRDLDVPVAFGAPLDERQGGQEPFGVGEGARPPRRCVGWLPLGRSPVCSRGFDQGPAPGVSSTGRGRSFRRFVIPAVIPPTVYLDAV
jgi:hypothetical protein